MTTQEAKADLLNQLKIDKSHHGNRGISAPVVIVGCLVSAALSAALVFFFAIPSSASDREIAIEQIQTLPPSSSTHSTAKAINTGSDSKVVVNDEILNASGYITARRITTVSSDTMGLLTSVDVEEGMSVKQGQVLAKLDDAIADVTYQLAKAQVEVLQARLVSIESDLAEARRNLARTEKLDQSKFSSEAQLTQAQTDVAKFLSQKASAEADIKVAKLEVKRQRELLDKYLIRAPFSGVVTEKNAQPGEIVSPSASGGFTRTGICTVVDMDSLEIEVDVNEAFIGRVYANQEVVATLDAYPDWDISAKVIAIIPTADRARATVRVRIGLLEKDPKILPDMGVKVAFLR